MLESCVVPHLGHKDKAHSAVTEQCNNHFTFYVHRKTSQL